MVGLSTEVIAEIRKVTDEYLASERTRIGVSPTEEAAAQIDWEPLIQFLRDSSEQQEWMPWIDAMHHLQYRNSQNERPALVKSATWSQFGKPVYRASCREIDKTIEEQFTEVNQIYASATLEREIESDSFIFTLPITLESTIYRAVNPKVYIRIPKGFPSVTEDGFFTSEIRLNTGLMPIRTMLKAWHPSMFPNVEGVAMKWAWFPRVWKGVNGAPSTHLLAYVRAVLHRFDSEFNPSAWS